MATISKPRTVRKPKFVEGEAVRIVPLHYPKPSFAPEGAQRDKGDLFDGKAHLAPLLARLTYRGGPLLQNGKVFTIFWRNQWQTSATSQPLMAHVNQFFTVFLARPLIDQLAEYNVHVKPIAHRSFIRTRVI